MNIRLLNTEDYTNFLVLINDFRKTSFTEEEFKNILTQIKPYSEIWVVEENNELIATATILYEQKFIFNLCKLAHIEDVCVKKEYRGKGLGKYIVQHCIETSKNNGCYKITLDCAETNSCFYEKCGFEKRGQQMTILLKQL